MLWMARLRRVHVRRPWMRWLAAAAVGLIVASLLVQRVSDLDERRRSWGLVRPVVIASREIAPGQVVSIDDVIIDSRPVAVIPQRALDDLSLITTGARAWQWIAAGDMLTDHDLSSTASPQQRLPPGTRGLILGSGGLPLQPGDRVEVVVDGRRTTEAVVVEVLTARSELLTGGINTRPILVAVPAAHAALVATSAAEGRVTVVLTASQLNASRPPSP